MAMRHVSRTHRVNLDWTYEVMQPDNVTMTFVGTKYQIADLMTKAITKKDVWESLLSLAGIRPPRGSSGKHSNESTIQNTKKGKKTNPGIQNSGTCSQV